MRGHDEDGRRRAAGDGGEVFCAACGEPYDATRDKCPACGLAKGEAPGDDEPDATSESEGRSPDRSVAEGDESTEATRDVPDQSIDPDVLESDRDTVGDEDTDTPAASGTNARDTGESETVDADDDPTGNRMEAGPNEEYCSSCGKIVSTRTATCPHCGAQREHTDSGSSTGEKRPIVAGVLSLIIPGAGHAYALDIKRSGEVFLVFMGAWILTAVSGGLGALAVIAVWLWAPYDAYSRTKRVWG